MENWREVESVLNAALRLPPAERESFLAGVADTGLRDEVASLLAADAGPNALTLDGIVHQAATILAEEPSPQAEIGHFRVIRELGRGGMGVVYLATDLKLRREVALKLLPPAMHLDPERRARFEREARLAAALNDANIVTIFEVGESQGRSFIATELVRGETLAQVIARGRLQEEEAVRIARQILAGFEQPTNCCALAIAVPGVVLGLRDLSPARALTNKDVLVLADFANKSGDAAFDGTLRQALAIHLEQYTIQLV